MLSLALTLTLSVTPAPHGFSAAHSVELITEVDKRLAKWMTHSGDRAAMLANEKELESFFTSLGAKNAKELAAQAAKEQADKPELTEFTTVRVLIEYSGKETTLNFFDGVGHRCEVPLMNIGTEAKPRYVLLGGPRTDMVTIGDEVERGRTSEKMMVFAEKEKGAWTTGSLPKPPPPSCDSVLKKALKQIYVAERSYFAEKDEYSKSLSKIGVDPKTLGVSSVKVSVAGAAPSQTFIIEVGHASGGIMTMNEKGDTGVIAPCK